MDRAHLKKLLAFSFLLPCVGVAQEITPSEKPFYIAANAGIFQGTFNTQYTDQSDAIPQNIAETIQQQGYTGGLALGYSKTFCQRYLLGAEIAGGAMTQNAIYQSGSATSAFTDKIALRNYFDLVIIPGLFLTPSLASYLKIGATYGQFTESLNTPTGYNPTFVYSNPTENSFGFTASLGLKKWLTPVFGVYAEYNYRDYGTVSFPSFQNFQTNYSHSAKIVGQSILLGLTYQLA